MKAQIDIALTIGAIVIPAVALIGSLIFAFHMIGPITDAAKLAAVISHDIVTLGDVAYSVPDEIEIYYKPPAQCLFMDISNPNAGCSSTYASCSLVNNESVCKNLFGCWWDGTKCKKINCTTLNQDECNKTCGCFWNDTSSKCYGSAIGVYNGSSCSPECEEIYENGVLIETLKLDCCNLTANDETTCKSFQYCKWEEPQKRTLVCLNGFMNISLFQIKKHNKYSELPWKNEDFAFYTEGYLEARLPEEVYTEILKVPYPGHANIKDYGFFNEIYLEIVNESIKIKKIKGEVFDSLYSLGVAEDPLRKIIKMSISACLNEENYTFGISEPKFYYLKKDNELLCLGRTVSFPYDLTTNKTNSVFSYDISCVNFSEFKFNTINCTFYLGDIDTFTTDLTELMKENAIEVNVTTTCLCDNIDKDGKCALNNQNKYTCNNQVSPIPWYKINITFNVR